MKRVIVVLFFVVVGLWAIGVSLNSERGSSASSTSAATVMSGGRVGLATFNEGATICVSPETIARSIRALAAGDGATSNEIIGGRDCTKARSGLPVELTGRFVDIAVSDAPNDEVPFVEIRYGTEGLGWTLGYSVD